MNKQKIITVPFRMGTGNAHSFGVHLFDDGVLFRCFSPWQRMDNGQYFSECDHFYIVTTEEKPINVH